MAKFERPTDTYTPTSTTVNINKYNDDSNAVPPVPISSTKVDADVNKLIDAVNEIDGLNAGGAYTDLPAAVNQIKTNEDAIAALAVDLVPDGDYGDITVSGGATTWTIDNEAVTEAKLSTGVQDKLNEVAQQETFVSNGTSTAGKVAVLKADGTVGAVEVDADTFILNSLSEFTSLTDLRLSEITYIPDGNKVAVIYSDIVNDDVYVVVGEVSGTTVSWGTPQQVINGTAVTGRVGIMYNETYDCLFMLYDDSSTLYGTTATISGTVLTIETATAITGSGSFVNAFTLEKYTADKYVAFSAQSTTVYTQVFEVTSATTFTYGTLQTQTFTGRAFSAIDCSFCVNGLKAVFIAGDTADNKAYCFVGNISGDTFTWETTTQEILNNDIRASDVIYNSVDDKYIFAYEDDTAPTGELSVRTAILSGNTLTFGTPIEITGTQAADVTYVEMAYDPVYNRTFLYSAVGGDNFIIINTTGATITYTSSDLDAPNAPRYGSTCYNSTDNSFITCFKNGDDNKGDAVVATYGNDADNYIGINQNTALDGEDVNVIMYGGTAKNLTSLTVNTNYFVDDDGSLITTDNGRFIGKAVKSTTLNMNRP